MKDVMIDIETLGLTPDSVILSIAAVEFDWHTGETGNTLYYKIDPNQFGRFDCPKTRSWWSEQDADAFAEAISGKMLLGDAIQQFAQFSNSQNCFWSQGTDFDFPILEHAMRFYGVPTPWRYSAKRDTRTVYHVCGFDPKSIEREGTHHNALADCHHQIRCVVAALKRIKAIQ